MDNAMVIRIVANTAEFKKALAEGRAEIVTTTAGMQKLAASLDGNRLIQHAHNIVAAVKEIGGATKLTEAEKQRLNTTLTKAIEKYQALGKEAPAAMIALQKQTLASSGAMSGLLGIVKQLGPALGLTFGVGAVIGFAKEVGAFAGDMLDLSAQTRVSTDRLQAFNIAGSDVGLTIQDITGNMDQLARRVGSGDKSAVGALERLNIDVEKFKTLGLDDALFLIDKQAQSVTNQFDLAAIRAELFGKAGQRMGRMMDGSLEQNIKSIEKTRSVIDHELLEAADRFDDAWKRAWISFRAYSTWAILGAIELMGRISFPGAAGAAAEKMAKPPLSGQKRDVLLPSTGSDTIEGSGVPAVTGALSELDRAYLKLNSDIENERGLFLMKLDADLLNASLSEATQKLTALAMKVGPLGVLQSGHINPALAMQGPGAMPYGGNLYTYGSGVPLIGQSGGGGFFGGMLGNLKDMWQGMSGGKGMSGLFSNIGKDILSGGLNSLMNLGVSAIGKGISALVGKLFGGEGKKTNDLRDQLFGGMGGFDQVAKLAAEAGFSMDRLLQPKKVKDMEAAWKDFNQALDKHKQRLADIQQLQDLQGQRQEMLNDAIARYGFTLDELPEKIRNADMAKQAERLIDDFKLLTEAGFDVNTVIARMGDQINQFIRDAIRTGTEVPNKLRPMLEQMLQQGLLTDEAGNKLDDLSKIHFGDTLEEQFSHVLESLDEMIAKLIEVLRLSNGVPGLPSVPSAPPSTPPDLEPPIPMAAGGRGWVTQRTLFVAGEAGPEEYAFSGAHRRLGDDGWRTVAGKLDSLSGDLRRGFRRIPVDLTNALLTRGA